MARRAKRTAVWEASGPMLPWELRGVAEAMVKAFAEAGLEPMSMEWCESGCCTEDGRPGPVQRRPRSANPPDTIV